MEQQGPTQNRALRQPYTDPSAWFDAVYTHAKHNPSMVPWARQSAHPFLLDWLQQRQGDKQRALVVGCGLGDDAEALAHQHFTVTAFDVSPNAVAWCRERFPGSPVNYEVADLFTLPEGYQQAFDLVFDALTIQSLPPHLHTKAIEAIAHCVAPGGTLLIICHGREPEEEFDGPPWPLARFELDHIQQCGLHEVQFQDRPLSSGTRTFLAEYQK
ncbi:thiopurine S-methyltransferase [Thermosporothrix hazakensis]|jgi:SAM-dependent methyltransferase|uniref:Thiopurine S-methyltransferase n=1 Tax=Thermosporothrix hazakensis TaxID=644383 RepID=A0A326UA41_THEHA|nr:class I SAM-dependent methyltransferase [Thermosporothrix hazakensis]PZW31233.1 thiopurine S-methyltransferase [Thermosporothrix hazakensis]GCE50859.1 hypothetical protein KTH_57280 [Thermosporothrix hazakensis]